MNDFRLKWLKEVPISSTLKEDGKGEGKGEGEPARVLYWMNRDMRVKDNHALLYAREQAKKRKTSLLVAFCLQSSFLSASSGHYRFMLEGLDQVREDLRDYGIPFILLEGRPEKTLPDFIRARKVGLLVTDFSPLNIKKTWTEALKKALSIPICQVDAHNIVPVWQASDKKEFAARTLRPKINKQLSSFLTDFPSLEGQAWPVEGAPSLDERSFVERFCPRDGPAYPLKGGEGPALKALAFFLDNHLSSYDQAADDGNQPAQSFLSPYLHFGQLSAQRVALKVLGYPLDPARKEGFLDQLIIRKELADNFCYYEKDYDRLSGFWPWAQETLEIHAQDERSYLYDLDDFIHARTHDDLWNAGQKQMQQTGIMHGYMRMYWAKKILEWTPNPQEALEVAIYLNDSYSLDGRDPNGYAGIAWSIGGVHDHGWKERPVYGKIRYMTQAACKRKFDIDPYIKRWAHTGQMTLDNLF